MQPNYNGNSRAVVKVDKLITMEKDPQQRFPWEQKFAINKEIELSEKEHPTSTTTEIIEWTKQKFNLVKSRHRNTISKIELEKKDCRKLFSKSRFIKEK